MAIHSIYTKFLWEKETTKIRAAQETSAKEGPILILPTTTSETPFFKRAAASLVGQMLFAQELCKQSSLRHHPFRDISK